MSHDAEPAGDYQIVVFARPARGGKRKLLRTFRQNGSSWEPDDAQISRKYLASLVDWLMSTESDPRRAVEVTLAGVADAAEELGLHASWESDGSSSFTLHVNIDPPETETERLQVDHPLAAEFRSGAVDGFHVGAYEMMKASDQRAARKGDIAQPEGLANGTVMVGNTAVPMPVLDRIFGVLRANSRRSVNISAVKTVHRQCGSAIERLAETPGASATHWGRVDEVIASIVLPSSY
ncbi:hypothetical protein MHPYR_410056 [uncultured Mycobacterium sp.]|uniref:Uncharacterized protein n=1 Tax=uncultured Mycobacterium sp. TaxID=171292 RepID=A0A1Y5PF67_9MYCO|nr:hypothetical protein MHPYR_410056 [uncultured Mycobacterium sp.]